MAKRELVNLCKCGCGTKVAGTFKRGHHSRLPEYAHYRPAGGRPKRDGSRAKPWTPEDDEKLKQQVKDGVPFMRLCVEGHTRGSTRNRSRRLGLQCWGKLPSNGYGWRISQQAATEHPSVKLIYWAAGLFEGEGHARNNGNCERAVITQKDSEILYKVQRFFGGTVTAYTQRYRGKPVVMHTWTASGARARGFLLTIYTLLSTRRQHQVRQALAA